MGADKVGVKTGGFFQIFDWNRKSRKKLFSSGISPDGSKLGKKFESTLPATKLHLTDDDDFICVPSIKGSSDHSYASSVTDEEGSGTRAPGVVARLMGLDSMPSSSFQEPFSTPFNDSRSCRDNHSQSRSPEFYVNEKFNCAPAGRAGGYLRKSMEPRSIKMPSSPVERFQTEMLPPRTAKSLPITHHKLLSPIKSPGFTSGKNAAQIMEAAAKILDPGFNNRPNMKVKASSLVSSSSIPLKVHDLSESAMISHRTPHLLQLSKIAPVEFARKQLLNRSWNTTEDIVIFRSFPDTNEVNAAPVRGKGKSISLAVQAKANVQRREGLGMTHGNSQMRRETEESKISQSFRSHQNNQSKQQKKCSTSSAPVLRQNNQKQNCPSGKVNSASKQPIANQTRRKVLSGDSSCTKHKTVVNKTSTNSRAGSRKQGLEPIVHTREERTSSSKDFPQKKRLTEGNFSTKKGLMVDRTVVDRHETPRQPSVMIDEHTGWNEDRKSSIDVVSFTFTAPLVKPLGTSEVVETGDKHNECCFDASGDKNDSDSKAMPTLGLNVLSGDALNRLLEQKLKELTSDIDAADSFTEAGNHLHTVPDHSELGSTSNSFDTIPCRQQAVPTKFHQAAGHRQGLGMQQRNEAVAEDEYSTNNHAPNKLDLQHTSPLSVLEASSSNDSWQSSESSGSTNGSICQSSVLAQNILNSAFSTETTSQVADIELSDSASSSLIMSSSGLDVGGRRSNKKKDSDMDFVREMLNKTGFTLKNLSSYSCARESSNPLLFGKFGSDAIKKDDRGLLLDCMQECLDLQYSHYFQAGYQAWSKGVLFKGKDLAETVNAEISGWKQMREWTIDELVNYDMSTHFGKWVNFEIESFETGRDIEEDIFTSLIDEVLIDFCLPKHITHLAI